MGEPYCPDDIRPALRLAAPSWVVPGTVAENCAFLAGKVDEAALLFFETASCLGYTRQDLPGGLADLGLTYHAHLPLDLPWEEGGEAVANVCLALMDKIAFLGAERAVLHPPPAGVGDAALLDAFAASWRKAGRGTKDVLLENVRQNDLCGLWPCIEQTGLGLCLDLGHILAYGQDRLRRAVLSGALPRGARARMAHLNAPGPGAPGKPRSAHLPLDVLDGPGRELGEALCALLPADGTVVAEFFDWRHVERSLPLIDRWRGCSRGGAAAP